MGIIRRIHKWLSVIVAIQLLIWLISGLFFNLMDGAKAKGRTYQNTEIKHIEFDLSKFIEPKAILQQSKRPVVSIEQTQLLDKPYYLLTHKQGLYKHFKNEYSLIDAYNGSEFKVTKSIATKLALESYAGKGKVVDVTLINGRLDEYPKQQNASWRINLNDDINTSVYIQANSGRIVGHSDDHKRFADLMFKLHFMDYANKGSFNNIQIMLFAFITLWLTLTGIIWTIYLGVKGQYKLVFFKK